MGLPLGKSHGAAILCFPELGIITNSFYLYGKPRLIFKAAATATNIVMTFET